MTAQEMDRIRPLEHGDIEPVMRIWLSGNVQAHPFVPAAYWEKNASAVREQIAQAEVFVLEADGAVRGFIGLTDDFIAGLFVDAPYRGMGIGRRLLEHAKARHAALSLSVYPQNRRAADFYAHAGFAVSEEGIDAETGCAEWIMTWRAADQRQTEEST